MVDLPKPITLVSMLKKAELLVFNLIFGLVLVANKRVLSHLTSR